MLNSSLYPNKCVFLSTWLTKSMNQSAVPPCPHLDAFAWLWVLGGDIAIYNFKILALCDKKQNKKKQKTCLGVFAAGDDSFD